MVEDELFAQQFENAGDQVKKIGRVRGMNHVEAFTNKYDPGEQKHDRHGDAVLKQMARDPGERRERIAVDADAVDPLVELLVDASRTDDRNFETGLGQRLRFPPGAAI